MKKVALFVIDGFEETEAVATVDILRRGGVLVKIFSLTASKEVKGKHNINLQADAFFPEALKEEFDMLVIPGGTTAYTDHQGLLDFAVDYNSKGKLISAICAAPAVFGKLGILKGKKATIFPGMEEYLGDGVIAVKDKVVTDGNITTSRGPWTVFVFALRCLELLQGKAKADQVKKDMLVD